MEGLKFSKEMVEDELRHQRINRAREQLDKGRKIAELFTENLGVCSEGEATRSGCIVCLKFRQSLKEGGGA